MMNAVSSANVTDTQDGLKCIISQIFGGARRKLSTKYGLVVTLCPDCHREAEHAVHRSAATMQYLHEYGQRKAMQENGWDVQTFREIFGKNYLQEDET